MEINAILVGKWEVARVGRHALIRFPFSDRPSIVLALPHDQAVAFAEAILQPIAPSKSRRIN